MKTITSVEAQNKFGQLIDAAQRRPVAITRHGRVSVVVLSAEDYERRQRAAWDGLIDSMKRSQAQASTAGLTEEKLAELLADES